MNDELLEASFLRYSDVGGIARRRTKEQREATAREVSVRGRAGRGRDITMLRPQENGSRGERFLSPLAGSLGVAVTVVARRRTLYGGSSGDEGSWEPTLRFK